MVAADRHAENCQEKKAPGRKDRKCSRRCVWRGGFCGIRVFPPTLKCIISVAFGAFSIPPYSNIFYHCWTNFWKVIHCTCFPFHIMNHDKWWWYPGASQTCWSPASEPFVATCCSDFSTPRRWTYMNIKDSRSGGLPKSSGEGSTNTEVMYKEETLRLQRGLQAGCSFFSGLDLYWDMVTHGDHSSWFQLVVTDFWLNSDFFHVFRPGKRLRHASSATTWWSACVRWCLGPHQRGRL